MAIFATDQTRIYQHPAQLLQNLIRFDTTNPPGNEAECIKYLDNLLTGAGIQTQILARDPGRPNLTARLKGQGNAPPLLLYGHVDVVSTENQEWQHPPFGGDLIDGFIWGRGSLDMKGGVAMMVAAFLQAKIEGMVPLGDVMLALLSDEESGGIFGAKYLIEKHTSLFEGIRYAIGEFGGCTFYVGKKRFYPIMVSEKLPCMIEASIVGRAGYPSLAIRGGAMAKLAKTLQRLDRQSTPIHFTEVARQSIGVIANTLSFPSNIVLRQLLNPKLSNRVLRLLGVQGEVFEPMLHNTVNATAIRGADKSFILPERIVINLACLLLPGYSPDDMISELHQMLGDDIDLKVVYVDGKVPAVPDMGLFDTLRKALCDIDPEGIPLPVLMPIPTDGRTFSQLGIQTYGFIPMSLPKGFNFWQTTHAANERIPVEALTFGTEAIFKVLQQFGKR
jgi:acetylornithine deacetylase/succinyl-diaminopimelate desuccinylase-like protein